MERLAKCIAQPFEFEQKISSAECQCRFSHLSERGGKELNHLLDKVGQVMCDANEPSRTCGGNDWLRSRAVQQTSP